MTSRTSLNHIYRCYRHTSSAAPCHIRSHSGRLRWERPLCYVFLDGALGNSHECPVTVWPTLHRFGLFFFFVFLRNSRSCLLAYFPHSSASLPPMIYQARDLDADRIMCKMCRSEPQGLDQEQAIMVLWGIFVSCVSHMNNFLCFFFF